MKTLIVYTGQKSSKNTLGAAVAERVKRAAGGHENTVRLQDLYGDGFSPVPESGELSRKFTFDRQVLAYQNDVAWADILVFVYPDWWGFCPAILKGWIDRVFSAGFAYDYAGADFEKKELVRMFAGKKSAVICTADNEEPSPLHKLFWTETVPRQTGISNVYLNICSGIRSKSEAETAEFLDRAEADMKAVLK